MISTQRVIGAAAALGAAATVLLTIPAASAATRNDVPTPVACQANGEIYPNGTVINVSDPGTVPVVCDYGQWVEQIPGEQADGQQAAGRELAGQQPG
jgi:hypothetical protein